MKNQEDINEESVDQEQPDVKEADAAPSKEEELEAKIKDWENKYMRMLAEYDNFKKRSAREKDARYGDAVIDTISAILPVADSLELALAADVVSDDAKAFKEGVEKVQKQFLDSLEKLGVKPIEAVGEQFDPNMHNAVMHVEDETVDDNTIVEEFMKGYIYNNERVVRYSMVKVAN